VKLQGRSAKRKRDSAKHLAAKRKRDSAKHLAAKRKRDSAKHLAAKRKRDSAKHLAAKRKRDSAKHLAMTAPTVVAELPRSTPLPSKCHRANESPLAAVSPGLDTADLPILAELLFAGSPYSA
jgi:hypothetical protein